MEDWSTTDAPRPRAPFDCPASQPDLAANIRLRIDYTINIHMTAGYGKASRTRKASERGLVMDGYGTRNEADKGTSPGAATEYNSLIGTESLPAWRHSDGVNVLWFDGHVKNMRYGSIPTGTGDPAIKPERYFWGEGADAGGPGRTP
ncbi:hypothetical protein SDC9_197840 [bioreactor metagenome]|uniref:Uncharacterized protein n=1 Tax=bioreactor metagenome TaxID=1076179 RepID=A0A645IPE7_9ZZZZ